MFECSGVRELSRRPERERKRCGPNANTERKPRTQETREASGRTQARTQKPNANAASSGRRRPYVEAWLRGDEIENEQSQASPARAAAEVPLKVDGAAQGVSTRADIEGIEAPLK